MYRHCEFKFKRVVQYDKLKALVHIHTPQPPYGNSYFYGDQVCVIVHNLWGHFVPIDPVQNG